MKTADHGTSDRGAFIVIDGHGQQRQQRDQLKLLLALARQLKDAGVRGNAILWALRDWNERYCDPPFEDEDLQDLTGVVDPQWGTPLPPGGSFPDY